MNYEEFVCYIQTELNEKIGKEVRIESHQVTKNNAVVLDALSFHEENSNVAPTIYLNEFYEEYQDGKNIEEILELIIKLYFDNRIQEGFCVEDYTDFERVKGNLACKLINRDKNEELLTRVPYMEFLDLALVVYYKVHDDVVGNGTILVCHNHCRSWNVSEEKLFETARKNMKQLLPVTFANIEEILGIVNPGQESEVPMYVLTNSENYLGASCVIYDSVLAAIGKKLKDDFWVLPSSIHECIVIPAGIDMTGENLRELVEEVNEQEVLPEDYLSDEVYYYDRDLHKLEIK